MNITKLKVPALRHFVESQPWAVDQRRGLALLERLAARATGDKVEAPSAAQPEHRAARGDRRSTTKSGGAIAVLPLYGVIAQRMDMMMAYCGGTSAERFADEFDAAMKDPDVSAIVIDCDSPGGSVQGTPELAKRIYDARGKGKKLIAVSNSCMASAAYWVCSACDEVVASPSAETGSIGVYTVHVDQSGMNEKLGLEYTLIKAGEHKAEGNPWEPLSADAEAFIQSQVDEMYGAFVGAVAKHRGIKVSEVNENFGQGRCFTSKQALAVGMIDRIATLEDVLKKLGAKDVGMSGRPQRAFGAAAATMMGEELVRPLMLGKAEPKGDTPVDPDPDDSHEEDDDDDDLCPECQGEMKDGICQACGYKADDDDGDDTTNASASAQSAAANGDRIALHSPVAGAADAGASLSPDSRPHAAQESTMDEQLKKALEAERKRAASIRTLARDHQIPENEIDALVESGVDENGAAAQILTKVKARHAANPSIVVGADRAADRKFANAGEQLFAIMQAGRTGVKDPRLVRVMHNARQVDAVGFNDLVAGTPSGMNESVGSEGGFFIAPEVLPGVIEPIYTEDPILSRVTRIPIGSATNRVVYNVVDETARTDGNRWGGIQMFWGDEADTATAKKPKMRQVEQLLKKIIGIAYLTDELVQDAPASQVLLQNAFQAELRFMICNAVFRGPGGGQPLGFTKSKAGVQQAIEGTQTIANSNQFVSQNVAKMLQNIPAALWPDVMYLYNQELLATLVNATIGTSSIPVFIGAGGLPGRPADTILGKTAAVSELCEQVGTPGDLVAIAPSQYHLAEKGGAQVATSLHVRFLNDELTMRITYRLDGKPVWNQTVAPYKGTAARGFFSTLGARA